MQAGERAPGSQAGRGGGEEIHKKRTKYQGLHTFESRQVNCFLQEKSNNPQTNNIIQHFYNIFSIMSSFQPKITTHAKKKRNSYSERKNSGNRKSHCMGKNVVIIKQKFRNMVAMNEQIRNEGNHQ